jgi:CBS domain-containing protein
MMPLDTPLNWAPDLKDAIERNPLTVAPTTSLADALVSIGLAHRHQCSLVDDRAGSNAQNREVRASCVLVMQDRELLGILTERDVVRLTAEAIDFTKTTVADVMSHPVITLPQEYIQDIFATLFLFRRYRIRHLPIVDDLGKLVGIVSHESIRQILRPANLLRFRRVADVVTTQVIRAPLTTTVLQLAQLMAEHRVSCVAIVQPDAEDNDRPVGIVTERDIVQFQTFQIDLHKTQAQTVMSTPLFLLCPEDSLWTAHQEMQKRRVGRLLVSWNWGQGLGIVTQTSILRIFDPMEMYGVIENLQQTIQQLEAERSPTAPAARLEASTTDPDLQDTLLQQNPQPLLFSIDSARKKIEHMLADLDLAVDRRQSLLQSVLETLEQLDRQISS